MRVVFYLRCSDTSQETENQRKALAEWVDRRGFQTVAIYEETASGWKDGHQSELSRLLTDARKARFDAVVVWSLDRLTRGGPHKILSMVHRFAECGVRTISFQEPWTEAPGEMGELLYSIVGWIAQFESRRLSERTKAGLERARAQAPNGILRRRGSDKKRRKRRSVKIMPLLALDSELI